MTLWQSCHFNTDMAHIPISPLSRRFRISDLDITPNRVTEFNILFEVATKSKSKEDKAWAKQRLRQMCCEVVQ